MGNIEKEKKDNGNFLLEIIKTVSLFLSTVVVALTGYFLTYQYNSSQIEINKSKELSLLLPKLKSADENEIRQSIIGLSLYGKSAVLPLISTWSDSKSFEINTEILNSIISIGDVAIPDLLKVYNNRYEDENKRSWCLLALVNLKYKDSNKLIHNILYNNCTEYTILTTGALCAGQLKCHEMTSRLIQICEKLKDKEKEDLSLLLNNIIYSLGELGGSEAKKEIKVFLENKNEVLKERALRSYMKFENKDDLALLTKIASEDENETIRNLALYSISLLEIKINQ